MIGDDSPLFKCQPCVLFPLSVFVLYGKYIVSVSSGPDPVTSAFHGERDAEMVSSIHTHD